MTDPSQRSLPRRVGEAFLLACFLSLAVYGVVRGALLLDYSWHWNRIPAFFFREVDGEIVPGPLVRGLEVTLELTLLASVATVVGGLVVALASRAPLVSARLLSRVYVEVMRNTPLVVQLYILYFMLSNVLRLGQLEAGVLALALYESAFAAEIFRGGIDSVDRGQSDAARSLGLGRSLTYRKIVLPQALPVVLPPLTNLFVNLFKHSSIVTVIALGDLTDAARNLINETFMVFEVWLVVAAIYVVFSAAASFLIRGWEARLKRRVW